MLRRLQYRLGNVNKSIRSTTPRLKSHGLFANRRYSSTGFALERTNPAYHKALISVAQKTIMLPYNVAPFMHFEPFFHWENLEELSQHMRLIAPYSITLNNIQPWQLIDTDVISPELNCVLLRVITGPQSKLEVWTGPRGINLRENQTFDTLLKNHIAIPPQIEGYLVIPGHVPCRIVDPTCTSVVLKNVEYGLEYFPTYQQNKNRYFYQRVLTNPKYAKERFLMLRDTIQSSDNKQMFGKEETLVVQPPTPMRPESATLMYFNGSGDLSASDGSDAKTTESHYHPGDRHLRIYTHDKPAGVVLNFAGINENIRERKDLRTVVTFDQNSYCRLGFDAFSQHEFFGEFACISDHPLEGYNIAESDDPKIKKAFLEYATVSSVIDDVSVMKRREPKYVKVPLRSRHFPPLNVVMSYEQNHDRLRMEVFETVLGPENKSYTKRPLAYNAKTHGAAFSPGLFHLDKEQPHQYFRAQFSKMKLGDYSGVIMDCNAMLVVNPENFMSYHVRGIAKMQLKQYNEAIKDFTQALKYKPNFSDNYCHRGICNYIRGDYRAAISDFDKNLLLDPDCRKAYFYRGLSYQQVGDVKSAAQDLDRAVAIKKKIKFRLSQEMDNYRLDIMEDLDQAVTENGVKYLLHRGINNYNLNNLDEACADFDKTIKMAAELSTPYDKRLKMMAHFYKLKIFMLQEKIDLAEIEYKEILAAFRRLESIKDGHEYKVECEEQFIRDGLMQLHPYSLFLDTLCSYASALVAEWKNKHNIAHQLFIKVVGKQSVSMNPLESYEWHLHMARIYAKLGNWEKVLLAANKAAGIFSNTAVPQLFRYQVYLHSDNIEQADHYYRLYKEYHSNALTPISLRYVKSLYPDCLTLNHSLTPRPYF